MTDTTYKVSKTGAGNLQLNLGKTVLDPLNVREGDRVTVEVGGDRIVLEKNECDHKNLTLTFPEVWECEDCGREFSVVER